MKKRPSLSPRQLLLYAVLFILFASLVLFLFRHRHDEKEFSKLTHDLFVAEMTANTLNMHYSIANPENFGIHDYKPVLPGYHNTDDPDSGKALESLLTNLSEIHADKLKEADAYTYELLVRQLKNTQKLNEYSLYQMPLSPSSGMQSQLPILLAEYTFRNKRDVEDYLALLDQTDDYFDSLLAFEKQKAAAGLSMSTYSLRQTKNQCDTIITKETLEEGTHFLQTTFRERLDTLLKGGSISSKEYEKYLSENDRLLRTVVQPAYEALADGLFLLEDSEGVKPLPSGLAALPDGREYYQHLLISEVGTYRPVQEVQTLLKANLQEEYNAIRTIIQEHPELKEQIRSDSYSQLPLTDADAMLADLQKRMQKDFPGLPETGNKDNGSPVSASVYPRVTVKNVSPNLQENCAPAFYLTAPLDDTDDNVIYINQKNALTGLDLYTTLAHEGYPGHLYQTVYNNRNFMNQGENYVRQLLWYGGYLEGWALYVEFYGYDYASALLQEQGRDADALCVQLEKHNRRLLLCLYATLDTLIHYENASREDIAAYLEEFGIYSENAVNAVYCYIADEPCNYLKYYLGYLEIIELKKAARTLWQNNYTDYAFHRFVLDAGPSDFTTLTKRLKENIQN